ncbi:collagenase [Actinosynnema sp. NPDC047251]|uniref:microbial collagenase n=1 Tax=Saccharothrix espanaensis (strain ATCC 51144 / DSM 44229 / JCM 9112 / NBRC 15066 / NRRL 15764) TaxID=1179773 RepID=K0JQL6_SACES|nr:collagenase [Saccharothrix espanaensis]CCH29690.1 Microbial collagenase [Saccharothrix espanaensis DSM 44229]
MAFARFRRCASLLAAVTALTTAVPAQAVPDNPATQNHAVQNKTGQDKTGQNKTGQQRLPIDERAPLSASKDELRRDYGAPEQPARPSARAAACNTADFTGKTGSALVAQIRSSTTDCVNTLFNLTGTDAYNAFREAQMTSVAYGLRDNGSAYPGNNSTGTAQLALYLRAGYYVQWYNESVVGSYGPTLRAAVQSGLDSFFANPRAFDVNDANGETLSEAVTLIDSSQQNARYLYVVKRLLNGYNASYDGSWWMLNAVNNVYTVLFRGHQVPEFVTAVQRDPSVVDTLQGFATNHLDLLSGDRSYLTSNAGRELGRFLQHTALQAKVRPQAKALLGRSSVTGATAPLWVGVAEMTDSYDKANCAYYDTCDLPNRLAAAVLPINHTCSSTLRIRAQQMSADELSRTCASLLSQDAYFHRVVDDPGPVAGDGNTALEVIAYNSSTDYQTYAGAMWGIDTNNGGMYLEGDPSAAGNQARFIAYEAEWLRPAFEIWNLNHEYTHYLDGRFDMHGDFNAGMTTPTIWWVEGFGEYISYHYRNVSYDAAITEAGRRTYALSTLFDTTYSHDTNRIYRWGYLAVRYLLQSHPADVARVLGYYRTGNWTAARTYLKSTIGTRYDNDWYAWLSACAAGSCGGGTPTNSPPVADFTATASGRVVAFADRSTDPDGTISARRWDFGDGTAATTAAPSHTYTADGTYTVRLTVTDNGGATATATKSVTISGTTACTGSDTRELGRDCGRANRSATDSGYDYLYLPLPAGTTSLRITASGGTGNCDLFYSGSSWATAATATHRSTAAGNTESITVADPAAGYAYVSLKGEAACSGVTVTTRY